MARARMAEFRLRPATYEDVVRYAGHELPEDWCIEHRVVGHAAEAGGEVVAVGYVTWDMLGRCWGWFSRRDALSPFLVHRKARATMRLLREVGEPALYAICNAAIPRAEEWLRRLGFHAAPEVSVSLGAWWKCDLST